MQPPAWYNTAVSCACEFEEGGDGEGGREGDLKVKGEGRPGDSGQYRSGKGTYHASMTRSSVSRARRRKRKERKRSVLGRLSTREREREEKRARHDAFLSLYTTS
jgi:hypothetical protein